MDVFEPCDTAYRVNLMDIDLNLHMNNGRYFSIMDLARFDLLYRAGVFGTLFKTGHFPIVASESIRFRKSLKPFQKFIVRTQIISWDEKDFFVSQKFISKGKLYGEGFIKGRFKKKGVGSVPTKDVFKVLGKQYEGPSMLPLAKKQAEIESLLATD